MKLLMCGAAMSLSLLASGAQAELTLNVDGTEYTVSALMENCQSITGQPEAKIACFTALSEMLNGQSGDGAPTSGSVTDALNALRAVAQYQDDGSGLSIEGTGCSVQIVYFSNYFHISRRNVSSIDLYSAKFDASKLQFDQISDVRGAQVPLARGLMDDGVTAVMRGGVALESAEYNFSPKSARTTIDAYAIEVADQLPANENQTFDFVLVHPQRSNASEDIWSAFETFVSACKE